jgi:HEAT repeat protein
LDGKSVVAIADEVGSFFRRYGDVKLIIMYSDDDLKVLDIEADLADPLDQLEDESKPDPEVMLRLLNAEDMQQRMLATRAFCDLQDSRAIPRLIELLSDDWVAIPAQKQLNL